MDQRDANVVPAGTNARHAGHRAARKSALPRAQIATIHGDAESRTRKPNLQ